jgi:hypothetical protein
VACVAVVTVPRAGLRQACLLPVSLDMLGLLKTPGDACYPALQLSPAWFFSVLTLSCRLNLQEQGAVHALPPQWPTSVPPRCFLQQGKQPSSSVQAYHTPTLPSCLHHSCAAAQLMSHARLHLLRSRPTCTSYLLLFAPTSRHLFSATRCHYHTPAGAAAFCRCAVTGCWNVAPPARWLWCKVTGCASQMWETAQLHLSGEQL